jgi:hypothetical protein
MTTREDVMTTGYAAAAAAWRAAGWRGVLPLPRRSKTPPPAGYTGQAGAWPDEATIGAWIATGAPNACLRLPDGVLGVDVDAYDDRPGGATLDRLEQQHGQLPATWTVTSRTDGTSGIRLYRAPTGIRWKGEAGAGIEIIQHRHRYVVLPPSIHPEGREYHLLGPGGVIDEHPPTVQQLPTLPDAWVGALREPDPTPTVELATSHNDSGPLDRWKQRATVDDLKAILDGLGAHSWRPVGELWHCTRPGKPAGTSAVVGLGPGGRPGNVVHVHTPNWPGLPAGTYTASDLLVVGHGGDRRTAARAVLEAEGWRPPDDTAWLIDSVRVQQAGSSTGPAAGKSAEPDQGDDNDWRRHDLVALVAGLRDGTLQRETPQLVPVVGGLPLLYRARIHTIFGESGGGKTWVAVHAAATVLLAGGRVLWIDWEDAPVGLAQRLHALGLTDEQVGRVDYRSPSTGLLAGLNAGVSGEECELAVIDSWGEAMAAGGIKQNDDDAVASWVRIVKKLADGGAAVLLLDHVPKAVDAPALFGIGSQRKRAAITGAAYRIDTAVEPARGKSGIFKLRVAKDRLGARAKGSIACEVHLESLDGGDRVRIECRLTEAQEAAAKGQKFRPTIEMEKVSRFLEEAGEASQNKIKEAVGGNDKTRTTAIEMLVEEGWCRRWLGPRASWMVAVERPFRAASDQLGTTFSHLLRPSPDLLPEKVGSPDDFLPTAGPSPVGGGPHREKVRSAGSDEVDLLHDNFGGL